MGTSFQATAYLTVWYKGKGIFTSWEGVKEGWQFNDNAQPDKWNDETAIKYTVAFTDQKAWEYLGTQPLSGSMALIIPAGLTNDQVFTAFRRAFNDVFKRYNPQVSTGDSSATGTAVFGEYPVEFTLDTAGGEYKLTGTTGLQKQGHLEMWLSNVTTHTETYCSRIAK